MRFCLLPIILFKEAHFVLNGNETVGSEHKKGEVMPLFLLNHLARWRGRGGLVGRW